VDDADLFKATTDALFEIFFYHAPNVLRRERMQVDLAFDGKDDRLFERRLEFAGRRNRAVLLSGPERIECSEQPG